MKKWTVLLLMMLLPACRKEEGESLPRYLRENEWLPTRGEKAEQTPPEEPEVPDEPLPDVYQTAFFFPDSVDWRSGDARGVRILVLKNATILGSVEIAGTPPPEGHRILDGALWWDSTDSEETLLYCDGEERFRWAGEERVQGLLCVDGQVHSLGQRPGGGFSYRCNGEERFSSSDGVVQGWAADPDWPGGALRRDGDILYYTYREPDGSLVLMGGDVPVQRFPPSPEEQVLDAGMLDGEVYHLSQRADGIFLTHGESAEKLAEQGRECRLVLVDGRMMGKGYTPAYRDNRYWIRDGGEADYSFGTYHEIQGIFAEGGSWAAVEQDYEACVFVLWQDGQAIRFPPETYVLSMDRCAAFRRGCFAAALTSDSGNEHWVQIGPKAYTISFNGYFTGTYIE